MEKTKSLADLVTTFQWKWKRMIVWLGNEIPVEPLHWPVECPDWPVERLNCEVEPLESDAHFVRINRL